MNRFMQSKNRRTELRKISLYRGYYFGSRASKKRRGGTAGETEEPSCGKRVSF